MPVLPSQPARRWLLAAALLLAVGVGAWLAARALLDPGPARDRVAVAVFVNRTGDPTLEPLGSMAADWVKRGLTQTDLVDVVDVGAIYVHGRAPGGTPTDPHQLALRNGAGTVVAGSYYLATDTLVIRATVEDAVSGTVLQTVPPVHVPADQAMRALDRLREQVVVALAGVFDVRYSPFTARPSAPRSFAAYQAFVAGQVRVLARPTPCGGAGALRGGAGGGLGLPRLGDLAGLSRGQRRRLRTHRFGGRSDAAEARGAPGVSPSHAGHQCRAMPQPVGGGVSARETTGRAPAPLHVCRLHRRILRTHERPLP